VKNKKPLGEAVQEEQKKNDRPIND
jgi:hypothetical protein